MYNRVHAVRNTFIQGAALLFILIFSRGSWAQPTDCQTELGGSSGYASLSNGASASAAKGVEEWDGEVLKLRTALPGVLTIEGNGPGLQGSLYTDASSGPYPMLDSAQVGTNLPELQTVVPAGDHCIQVTAGAGEDDFEIQATFIDVCHLGDADDHGDSSLCATPLTLDGGGISGQISSFGTADIDRFKFYLGAQTNVVIASTGSTDVEADLYQENGTLVDSDDDGGGGGNFRITAEDLEGWYYVRVRGANGSYSVSLVTDP